MNKFHLLILLILVSIQSNSQEASDNWVFHHQPDDGWFGSIVKDNNGNIIVGGGIYIEERSPRLRSFKLNHIR